MRLIYLGAEIPSNKTLLTGCGVTHLGVAFNGLRQRVKQEIPDLLVNFTDDVSLHAVSGLTDKDLPEQELRDFAKDYEEFIESNRDRLSSWVEFDSRVLGPDWVRQRRAAFYDQFDDQCFRPVWHFEHGVRELEALSDRYPHVAIPLSTVQDFTALPGLMRQYINKYETQFHLLGVSKPEMMNHLPSDTIYTSGWQSPMRHGETILFDGGRLHRYPAKMKDEARSRHRVLVENLGLDVDKVLGDVPSEVTKLAIHGYRSLENEQVNVVPLARNSDLSDKKSPQDPPRTLESGRSDPTNSLETMRQNGPTPIKSRHPAEMELLPGFGLEAKRAMVEDSEGNTTISELPVITSGGRSVRNCNTCYVANNCPAFTPDTECAFQLPVEIKTQDQLKALMQAMIEMQGSRIGFAKYAEELNGGYPDVTVSREVDRLFKMVESLKKMEQNSEFIKVSVERQSSGGVLSALFGDRAGEKLAIDPDVSDN